jgi:hypothetical protein
MEALNVQSDHIAKVVGAFLPAATSLNVVKTVRRAGIGAVLDDGVLRYRTCSDQARCLLLPITAAIPGMPDDESSDDHDQMEIKLSSARCASLLLDCEQVS